MTKVTIHEAKTNLSKLIAKAMRGEDIVIHKNHQPMVRLTVVQEKPPKRCFGAMKGLVDASDAIFDSLPANELEAWGEDT
jgi:prevent-host-death family protein